jgi:hypothetical protein
MFDPEFNARVRVGVLTNLSKTAKDPELRKQSLHTLTMWALGMGGQYLQKAAISALEGEES